MSSAIVHAQRNEGILMFCSITAGGVQQQTSQVVPFTYKTIAPHMMCCAQCSQRIVCVVCMEDAMHYVDMYKWPWIGEAKYIRARRRCGRCLCGVHVQRLLCHV